MSSITLAYHNLSEAADYPNLYEVLPDLLQQHTDADSLQHDSEEGYLAGVLRDTAPESAAMLETGRSDLVKGAGAVILRGTGIEALPEAQAVLLSLMLSTAFGEPTVTDPKTNRFVWPVTPDPDFVGKPTFSQLTGEAAFHTDSQFKVDPEDYFMLACMRPADDGGANRLIHVDDIVETLQQREDGADIIKILEKPFPFRTPDAFTASGDGSVNEVTRMPILQTDTTGRLTIRYREDTILAAADLGFSPISPDQQLALVALKEVLSQIPPTEHLLAAGEATVVNNRVAVHDRTTFKDKKRKLYRIRTRMRQAA